MKISSRNFNCSQAWLNPGARDSRGRARFRHKIGPAVHEWRIKNISTRYSAAGVRRFAFLLPAHPPVPQMMNQSSPGESFVTRGFNSAEQAMAWLTGTRHAEEGR